MPIKMLENPSIHRMIPITINIQRLPCGATKNVTIANAPKTILAIP